MAEERPRASNAPPEISPYVVSVLLAGFGLWCFYDGWISSAPEMAEHLTFNRIASAVLLPAAAWDYWRVRKRSKAQQPAAAEDTPEKTA